MQNAYFPTDLSDAQWRTILPHLPKPAKRGRPRTDLRRILDAVLYLVKSGCQWRLPPRSFPPWKTVHHIFRRWMVGNAWAALNAVLRACAREDMGKKGQPPAAILDSQTVRSGAHGGSVGYDAAKKTKGRKRFLLVDTPGLVPGAEVFPANTPERAGARELLGPLLPWFRSLRRLVGRRGILRDHEKTESSATAWIYIAMIRLMLNRLA